LEKLSNLLDETTILNFRLVWKLVGRYRSHLTIAFLAFCGLFVYFYFSQPLIYSVSVPVKAAESHTFSNDMTSLQPMENLNTLSFSELSVSLSSFSFQKRFAQLMIQEKNFDHLNFGSIVNGRKKYGHQMRTQCKNNSECIVNELVGALSGVFVLEQGMTSNRYLITVTALTKETAFAFARVISKAVETERIEARQYLVIKEMNSVENLIKESRSLLHKMNGFDVLEENEKTNVQIADLKEKIRILQASMNTEMANVSALEARLAENKRHLERSRKENKLTKMQELSLQSKIDDLRLNIATLSSIPENNRSISDKSILAEMMGELKKLEDKLSSGSRAIASRYTEAFGKEQEGKEKNIEFDYSVAKNNLARLEEEFKISKEQLEDLTKDKFSKETSANKFKTDIEFLKNLEAKQLSLKLMSSTMTSDIVFEDFGREAREFRRSTIVKIFVFSSLMAGFFYILSILLRYFMDDKIYSEDDLKTYFANLDFIGEVPSFD